ncbi:MAG: hypothetical protein Q4F97_00515 [Bacteroidales bacterium]|nr:hypothetical protein [Bacteroidales bacterium]
MKKLFYKSFILMGLTLGFVGCNEDDEPDMPEVVVADGVFVANAGNSSLSNASLSYYDIDTKQVTNNLFAAKNPGEELGSLANDMIIYGSKIYVVVSNSSKIEVLDMTGKRIKNVAVLNEDDSKPAQPRFITSYKGNVYFTAYDGYVRKMDTTSLSISSRVEVGAYPEALTVASNKLYVNNSGYGKGTNVSVINLDTFKEETKIEVGLNPYNMSLTASDGNVYIVTMGNYYDILSEMKKIDVKTNQVTTICNASMIANNGNTMYVYYSVWGGESWFKTYDLSTNTLSSSEFVSASQFTYVNSININPINGDVYLGDVPKSSKGNMYIFDSKGSQLNMFEVGYYPGKCCFTGKTTK